MTQPASPVPSQSVSSPAAPSAAPVASPPTGGSPAAPSWYEGSAPDTAAWIAEQKFNNLDELAASQKGLLKMRGVRAEELLHLKPGWEDVPEEAAKVYGRFRPETPDKYEIPAVPVGDGSVDLAPKFRTWAHELGLTPKQAKALATNYQGEAAALQEARKAAIEAQVAAEQGDLEREWGGAFKENEALASKAANVMAQAIGLEAGDIDKMIEAVGLKKSMKMLAAMGRSMGEHKSVDTGQSPGLFGMTPDAANQKADELTAESIKLARTDPQASKAKAAEAMRIRAAGMGQQVPDYMRPRS